MLTELEKRIDKVKLQQRIENKGQVRTEEYNDWKENKLEVINSNRVIQKKA